MKYNRWIRKSTYLIISSFLLLFFQPGFAKTTQTSQLINPLTKPYPAPAIQGITAWINSKPLTLEELHGKVVLIDFWTYSCVNCVRSLPYLLDWDKKYRNDGLVIIGIHSPEFPFEQKLSNVQNAVERFHIKYPVALDNQFTTWTQYNNQFWPAHYLIDKNGDVVYTHFGEGEYMTTENNIRTLLGKEKLKNIPEIPQITLEDRTPETYLGYERSERFDSTTQITSDDYHYPDQLPLHHWSLQGHWERNPEKITAKESGAAIKLHFYAKKVFLVLGTKNGRTILVDLLLNGKQIKPSLKVTRDMLYELVSSPNSQEGTLEIIARAPGLEAYAFTFG